MIITTDFLAFPDNHQLGPQFTISSIDFRDRSAQPSFVNVTDGSKGLQFFNQGLDVSLPDVAKWVRIDAGQFNQPFTIEAFGASGSLVATVAVADPNTFAAQVLSGDEAILNIRFTGGGNEAIVRSITALYG